MNIASCFAAFGILALLVGCGGSGSSGGSSTPSADSSSAADGPDKLPPEFFTVCEGKDEGTACEVTMEGKTMVGKCTLPPAESGEKRRVCKPDHLPE